MTLRKHASGIAIAILLSGCPLCPQSPQLTLEDFDAALVRTWAGIGYHVENEEEITDFIAVMDIRDDGSFTLTTTTIGSDFATTTEGILATGNETGVPPRIDLAVGCSDFYLFPAGTLSRGIYYSSIESDSFGLFAFQTAVAPAGTVVWVDQSATQWRFEWHREAL